jgi:HK97 family phage portal protein
VLRPDRVGTDINKDTGEVDGYFIRQAGGASTIPLEVNEVLRFPAFNPSDPYKGKGTVEAGSDYIQTDESTAAYTKNFFGNNAGLSGVLNIKGEVTKGAFRKFVRAWRDKYEGVGNAGKVAILRDSDAEFTKVGLGLDELDMANLRKMSLQDVSMMFKVPLELLGRITEGAGLGRGNIETLEYIFAKYNIDKKMKRFDNVIMFALQRYYGLDTANYRVVHKSIIPEDKEFELNQRDKGVDRWLKRNEVRDIEGLDEVDGGDQLFVPIQQIPINEAGADATTAPAKSAGITVKITRKKTRPSLPRLKKKIKAARQRLPHASGLKKKIDG